MYKKDILWTNRIKRPVVSPTYKENYLRLDKNEWVGDFNKKIIEDTLKKISFHKIIAYPDQYKLYKLISKINRLKINQIVLAIPKTKEDEKDTYIAAQMDVTTDAGVDSAIGTKLSLLEGKVENIESLIRQIAIAVKK